MRIINRLVVVLIFAMPTCLILVRWPVVFAIVGGGLCVLALVVMTVQIVFSEPLSQRLAPPVQASATVDGVPVRDVETKPTMRIYTRHSRHISRIILVELRRTINHHKEIDYASIHDHLVADRLLDPDLPGHPGLLPNRRLGRPRPLIAH